MLGNVADIEDSSCDNQLCTQKKDHDVIEDIPVSDNKICGITIIGKDMKKYLKLRSQEGRKRTLIRKKRDSKEAKKRKSTTPSMNTKFNYEIQYMNTEKADVNKKMKNTTPTKIYTPQEDTTNDRKI